MEYIFFTLSGIWILVRPVQSLKAFMPMPVTPSGMITSVRPVQPAKASLGIAAMPAGISMTEAVLSSLSQYSISSPEQPKKADLLLFQPSGQPAGFSAAAQKMFR